MNYIAIKHNPFTVETTFTIDGKEISGNNNLSEFKNRRLQLWIASLPKKLYEFFNQDGDITVAFTGLESDYLDLKEEIERANQNGTNIILNAFQPVDGVEDRLDKVQKLIAKAKKHPKFAHYLENDSRIKQGLEESFNKDFDAYVVATMSSGKSTFINAMLGKDLLPAREQATTATIARIFDTKLEHYQGERCDQHGNCLEKSENLNTNILNAWNDAKDTHTINIKGRIYGMNERENVRLVLTDTPGPNNSRDKEHARLTMSYIQDSTRNPLILYILNATQLGINDDKNLLGLVAKEINKGGKQAKDRFIFVVNKCDEFDVDKESLDDALANVKEYLKENGIDDPLVYPISAFATRLMRNNEQELTRKERNEKPGYIKQFLDDDYNFIKYMPLTAKVARKVEVLQVFQDDELNTAVKNSGIPAVELMIDEYIEKYNLPHRLNRAKIALEEAIKSALNEEAITLSLAENEYELKEIVKTIRSLEKRRNQGFQTENYKKTLKEKKNQLPTETMKTIKALRVDISKVLTEATNRLRGETSVQQANARLEDTERNLKFKFDEVINELDKAYAMMQKNIHKDLGGEYQKYVASIFEEVNELKFPVLAGLQDKLQRIDISVSKASSDEVKTKRVKTGQERVSDSSWWNPFSWGRTKLVDTYENREFVLLEELWADRLNEVRKPFDALLEDGIKHIQHGANDIVEMFIQFMTQEFDKQFNEIIADLTATIQDKDKREKAIADAKQELKWINALRSELDATLVI